MVKMDWVDYIILSNPQGVMKVLNQYGYAGYLAPLDKEEMQEAVLDLIQSQGDEAVVSLLKAHPLYSVIKEIPDEKYNFRNATGDKTVFDNLKDIDIKVAAENILAVIGFIYTVSMIIKLLKNESA